MVKDVQQSSISFLEYKRRIREQSFKNVIMKETLPDDNMDDTN
jgi:hypothetical protein